MSDTGHVSLRSPLTHSHRLNSARKTTAGSSLLCLALLCVPLAGGAQNKRERERLQDHALSFKPVIVAQAAASQQGLKAVDRVIGICHLSENPYDPTSAVNSMSPALDVRTYFRNKERRTLTGPAKVGVLQMPSHGALEGDNEGDFVYYPRKGYLGNDRASLLVEIGGKTIRIEYFFRVMKQVPDQEGIDAYADNCPEKVRVWKISALRMPTATWDQI